MGRERDGTEQEQAEEQFRAWHAVSPHRIRYSSCGIADPPITDQPNGQEIAAISLPRNSMLIDRGIIGHQTCHEGAARFSRFRPLSLQIDVDAMFWRSLIFLVRCQAPGGIALHLLATRAHEFRNRPVEIPSLHP
jgi:hypothetical protein